MRPSLPVAGPHTDNELLRKLIEVVTHDVRLIRASEDNGTMIFAEWAENPGSIPNAASLKSIQKSVLDASWLTEEYLRTLCFAARLRGGEVYDYFMGDVRFFEQALSRRTPSVRTSIRNNADIEAAMALLIVAIELVDWAKRDRSQPKWTSVEVTVFKNGLGGSLVFATTGASVDFEARLDHLKKRPLSRFYEPAELIEGFGIRGTCLAKAFGWEHVEWAATTADEFQVTLSRSDASIAQPA